MVTHQDPGLGGRFGESQGEGAGSEGSQGEGSWEARGRMSFRSLGLGGGVMGGPRFAALESHCLQDPLGSIR